MVETTPSMTDLIDNLPLHLIKSETIPPSPNVSESGSSAIDWLPDFAGHSWIGYGASSLLVISHFPSPLSPQQSDIGPVFRQVFQLSDSFDVSSVVWSPENPSSGEIAASAHNRIFLFQYESTPGCFCWSQTALLVQSAKIEAVAWTGSADGIISVGLEIVLWKRNVKSWEIAWKFSLNVPQTLVSSTWSLEGPLATGVYSTKFHAKGLATMPCNSSDHVSVFQYDGKSGYIASELRHPQPVLAMQWRPCGGRQLKDALYAPRHFLLTSCLDGATRLWCEVDANRIRKGNKENRDKSTHKRSFCVVAVIELNQSLGGILGKDIFLEWALEADGIVSAGGVLNEVLTAERNQNDDVGSCEWLIGVGPSQLLTFWSVHCLDDIATMRSPRVTLWKRYEVTKPDLKISCRSNSLSCFEGSYYKKVSIWRNQLFGPPVICSLIQFFPCNSLIWSVLYNQSMQKAEGKSSHVCEMDKLSCQSGAFLDTLGHSGKILQVAVHPYMHEVELAVSLDSNGLLIFWSISTNSNSLSCLPTLTPSWRVKGKFLLQETVSQDMTLYWAPSWLEDHQVLLIGHAQGIDCFIVKTSVPEEDYVQCHKLCTFPFVRHDHLEGPDKIISVPLHSTSKKDSNCDRFLLFGVWMKNCLVESWKLTLHSCKLSENGQRYSSDPRNNHGFSTCIYKTDFAGKTYSIAVSPSSSFLLDVNDEITSVSMVSPSISMHSHKLVNDCYSCGSLYHMATGHSDGRSRLWRFNLSESSVDHTPFELVGIFSSLEGPVNAISVADWGQKIATICPDGVENNVNMLFIWEPLHLTGVGTLELEDKICLHGKVMAFNWFQMENILFFGVCFQNELHIYSRRIYNIHASSDLEKFQGASTWVCIGVVHTSSTICDFVLGPRGTLIVIHENFFTLFSHWSFFTGKKHLNDQHLNTDTTSYLKNEMDCGIPAFSVGKVLICEELSSEKSSEDALCPPLTKAYRDVSFQIKNGAQQIAFAPNKDCVVSMTEIADKLGGPLPFYHPEALLMNIYSGNWKRAYASVCHLFDCLTLNDTVDQRAHPPKSSITIGQIKLSKYFEGQLSKGRAGQGIQWNNDLDTNTWSQHSVGGPMYFADTYVSNAVDSASAASTTSFEPHRLQELLEKLHPNHAVTDLQKMQMLAIIDLLNEISNSQSSSAYGSLDDPGRRFWCAIRLEQLDFQRRYSRTPSVAELVVDSRLMVWAFHSDCQASLFTSILPTEPKWEDMRKLGVGFWLTNVTDLRSKMEKLARSQYLKNKDPKACALLYIALNRLQVLAGLFKISKDEKDKPLVAFLSRNFQEERHRAAALKNAYVLMGRHQYELAIGFFLLGGDIISAITVCAKTFGDDQLALVICRLIEGQGGASERHLISKILLPSAIEKGDYWLASVLEWVLGNYLQSFLMVLGLQEDCTASESENSIKHAAFLDPSIGQFCEMLAAKNSLRNAAGERNTTILCGWATVMIASAFNKCGLPLEALDCLSSAVSILGVLDQRPNCGNSKTLPTVLHPSPNDSSRWLSHEVTCHLANQVKLDLAMQHVIKLFKECPCWINNSLGLTKAGADVTSSVEDEISQFVAYHRNFEQLLDSELGYLEQKFSVARDTLLDKIMFALDDAKLLLHGYYVFTSQVHLPSTSHGDYMSSWLSKNFVKASDYLSFSLPRFFIASAIASTQMLASSKQSLSVASAYCGFSFLEFYMQGLMLSISSLRAMLQCNHKALDAMLQLMSSTDENNGETDIVSLRIILGHAVKVLCLETQNLNGFLGSRGLHQENGGDTMYITNITTEDEKWIILRFCLWHHLSKFVEIKLNQLSGKLPCDPVANTAAVDSSLSSDIDGVSSFQNIIQVLTIFIETIGNTFTNLLPHLARQLAVFLRQKVEDGTSKSILVWLEEFHQSTPGMLHEHLDRSTSTLEVLEIGNSCPELLAQISSCPRTVDEMLAQISIKMPELIHGKVCKRWNHLRFSMSKGLEKLESYKQEGIFDGSPRYNKSKSPSSGSEQNHNLMGSDKKEPAVTKKVVPFNNPKEIYRRTGELLEALCINSVEPQHAALASNKKGISYFSWGDGLPFSDPSDYIWAQADWPQDGWACMESTPAPICISPSLSFGSNKNTQLGLDGATVGAGYRARIGRDLTGGGAFGIPGYAGIGATGMGWGMDEFDKFVDPPATLSNITGSALAAHPSRPFFLVGSSNTHIYLWEFGEEKAIATYGVLAAANVPPPYPLASVSGLQFDRCGHRFASSALDGTVSAWQLEVGGRSNVRPTESSLCFSGQVLDVCYVGTSGSIIAAAGYSSNGVNVVIWDTLAPPSSSRASVMCHEGGACSIAVFDNDVGTGSISPLIVTGGKGGDVGLHDFRYIATGKSKRRHSNAVERMADSDVIDIRSELSSSVGDQNRHGMLWYIPKAHSGSVTKISTIPNTSFFLTGSKDGDVKLWDAKNASLVFHWPRLHERHTFLQRNSQSFGGVSRVGVTDIQVISDGFLTCGGDGLVKMVQLNSSRE
ncbi:unnamed protein product [Amaranthus hypochondriacus]